MNSPQSVSYTFNLSEMLLNLCALIAFLAFSSIWSGYVITMLWRWFIVPAFGAPAISIPVAIGMSLLVRMLRPLPGFSDGRRFREHLLIATARTIIIPLVTLLIGQIAMLFV